jgi:hypothetical protein
LQRSGEKAKVDQPGAFPEVMPLFAAGAPVTEPLVTVWALMHSALNKMANPTKILNRISTTIRVSNALNLQKKSHPRQELQTWMGFYQTVKPHLASLIEGLWIRILSSTSGR